METYLAVTGILFHIIVGGILSLSAFFLWCARDERNKKTAAKTKTLDIEIIQMGAKDGEKPTVTTPK